MATVLDPIRRAIQVGARRPAVRCGPDEHDYASMWERIRRCAALVRAAGVAPGERVAVVAANSHRYLELLQAVPGDGRVIVPLNTRHTDRELEYALRDGGVRLLLTDQPRPALAAVADRTIVLGDEYEALLAAVRPLDGDEIGAGVGLRDLAGLFYTGGTTGAAKGVMLTHGNLLANTFHMLAIHRFSADTRWLLAAPMFHAAGSCAVLAVVWNAGLHLVQPAFEPAGWLDLAASGGATSTLLVPTMLAAACEEQARAPRDVSHLAFLAHGGSPCPTEVLRRARELFAGTELCHLYGATETAPIATAMPHEDRLLDGPHARSCGQATVGVAIRVVGDDGADVPVGAVGEVWISGANVMQGYWNKPAETAAALVDGWYRSGDLGVLDDEGYLTLVDRAKDMIVTGGENVYSTEVEDALYRHPAVLEAAVFGVPDERWGEAVHAVVVPRPGAEPTAALLQSHCRELIAGYKVPKRIDVIDGPLPKSGAGKILKRELREPFWSGAAGRIQG